MVSSSQQRQSRSRRHDSDVARSCATGLYQRYDLKEVFDLNRSDPMATRPLPFCLLLVIACLGPANTSDASASQRSIPAPGSSCSKAALGHPPSPEGIIRCLFAPEVIEERLYIGKWGFDFYYFTTRSLRHELDREIACTKKWNGWCSQDINPTVWNDDRDQVSILAVSFDGVGSAIVDFSNFGKPNRSIYRFKREQGRWLIDNIENQQLNEEKEWVTVYNLRDILDEGRKSDIKWTTEKLQR
jgi:hypothetical protein